MNIPEHKYKTEEKNEPERVAVLEEEIPGLHFSAIPAVWGPEQPRSGALL